MASLRTTLQGKDRVLVPSVLTGQWQERTHQLSLEKQELHAMEVQRRLKLRQMHKALLISELMEKQGRGDAVSRQRKERVDASAKKSAATRELIKDCHRQNRDSLRPVSYDACHRDWHSNARWR